MRWSSILVCSLILIFKLTLTTSSICQSADWHCHIVDDAWSGNTTLKLDSQDLPYILYDKSSGLQLAYYNGFEWEYETIEGTEYGGSFSMVLESQDLPHISYFGWYPDDLMYCYWDGSQWVIELVDDEDEAGLDNSITVDSYGNPHIAYDHYVFKGENDLRYAYKDEDGWHKEVVDDEFQFQGDYCSIAMDSQDRPHIAYRKSIEGNDWLSYAHWDGSQWLIETVVEMEWSMWDSSIAIDSQDHPHIAYSSSHDVFYAHWDGNEWLTEEFTDGAGCISLALDSQEYPNIAYASGYGIQYARWSGSEWIIEYAGGDQWFGGLGVSLDLDSEDKPHISCDEWIYGGIWYIWFGDPLTEVTLDHFSAHAEGSAISLRWSVQTTEGDQITGFNLYRRDINNNIAAEVSNLGCIWTKVNTGLITGQNPYTYTDSDVEANVAYEYKLEAVLADDSPEILGTTQATAGQPTSFSILALYPNPASDYLTCLLALPSAGVVELRLYDLSGRLVLEKRLEATEPMELEVPVDVSGLASGVYTLQASFGGAEVSPACGGVAVVVR